MPNTIKYSTTGDTLSLRKGNWYIGVGDTGKGPTSSTEHWSAIAPPSGGYTIYENKSANGPSIRVPADSTVLVDYANKLYGGSGIATAEAAITYLNGVSTIACVNIDYEPIITSGLTFHVDAGFIPSYYRTGTSWYDLSYNGNPITLINGPTYNSSNGGGIIFDGTNDYSSAGTSTVFDITGNLTVSSWVKPSLFTNQGNIVSKNGNGGYRMRFQSNGTFWLYANGNSVTSSSTYSTNNWYNAVGVFSSTGLRMYINGTLAGSNGNAFNPSYPTSNFYIGAVNASGGELFQGTVAIVSLYNRALNQTEITQNFNAQKSRFGL